MSVEAGDGGGNSDDRRPARHPFVITLSRLPWIVKLVSSNARHQVSQAFGPLGRAQHVVVDVLEVWAVASLTGALLC